MKFIPTALLAILFTVPTLATPHAQSIGGTPVNLPNGSLGSQADIAKRLELAGIAETLSPVQDALLSSNLSANPLFAQLMARMDARKLDQEAAQLMAQTFSTAELQALVSFLSSPAGRTVTQKMPAYQKMLGALMQNQFNAAFQAYSAQQGTAGQASGIPVNPTLAPASVPAYNGGGTPISR